MARTVKKQQRKFTDSEDFSISLKKLKAKKKLNQTRRNNTRKPIRLEDYL